MTTTRRWMAWRVLGLTAVIAVAGSLGGCPKPDGGTGTGNGPLAGTWTGTVSYTADLAFGNNPPAGQPFEQPFTVTFDAQDQPDHLDLVIDVNKVVLLSMAKLVNVGDTDKQTFPAGSGDITASTDVTATVKSVSHSVGVYSVTLDVVVDITGAGSLSGSYTLDATTQADGTLLWKGAGDLLIPFGTDSLDLKVGANGTLAKQ